jgi:hypothetical protein
MTWSLKLDLPKTDAAQATRRSRRRRPRQGRPHLFGDEAMEPAASPPGSPPRRSAIRAPRCSCAPTGVPYGRVAELIGVVQKPA